MLSSDLAAAPVHRGSADASAMLPGHVLSVHDGMRATLSCALMFRSHGAAQCLIVSRMDLAQHAVSRSEADGLQTVQMHHDCPADAPGHA